MGVPIAMVKNVPDAFCLKVTIFDFPIFIPWPCGEERRDETSSYVFTSDGRP